MEKVKWTKQQSLAIEEKGQNILVAAAAGSGKTAVLVERIINKIINEKIDIDKILVVTFTKAAAAEMRSRILDAIYKRIEATPEDTHLQRQVMLLSKASICTIDSFCLDVVKNNFFEIGISPNLKIADNTEIEILKQETLEEMFEEKYESEDEEFLKLINMYTTYKGDDALKTVVYKIYDFIQSLPEPEKWLEEKVEAFNIDEGESFEKTPWGEILFEKAKDELESAKLRLGPELNKIKYEEDSEKFIVCLSEDIRKINEIYESKTWDEMYDKICSLKFDMFPRNKNFPDELKEKIKSVRDKVKKDVKAVGEKILIFNSKDATSDIYIMYDILKHIKNLTLEFSDKFKKVKQDKNIVYFSDIEHFALDILTKDNSENEVTKKYREKFEEILIDEYQDSNLLQETILNSVSRGNNIFMVGDVKQSIYKFRGGRPELFLEKYERYKEKEEIEEGDELKIQLFKNFRSRKNVLDLTNIIFDTIMSKKLGDIDYSEKEYLNLGANYEALEGMNLELDIIDLKEEEKSIYKGEDEEDEEQEEKIDDIVIEAKFVAKRIKELITSGFTVTDKKEGTRKIRFKDIAILLRSTKILAPIYEQEISKLNIPVFSDVMTGYLGSSEIQVMMSLLKVIDNPSHDIPLVTVLRSMIGGFSDNQLIEIRLKRKRKKLL